MKDSKTLMAQRSVLGGQSGSVTLQALESHRTASFELLLEEAAALIHQHHKQYGLHSWKFGTGLDPFQREDGSWKFTPFFTNSTKNPFPINPGRDLATGRLLPRRRRRFNRELARQQVGGSHNAEVAAWGGCRPYFGIQAAHKPITTWYNEGAIEHWLFALGIEPGTHGITDQEFLDFTSELVEQGKELPVSIALGALQIRRRKSKKYQELSRRAAKMSGLAALVLSKLLDTDQWEGQGRLVRRWMQRSIGLKFREIRQHLVTLDIDAMRTTEGTRRAQEIAEEFARKYLEPCGFVYLIEPSRNGYGRYVRWYMQRTVSVAAWNRLRGALMAKLREQYPKLGPGGVQHPAHVDKVAALLAYYQSNHRYHGGDFDEDWYYEDMEDPDRRFTPGESYEYRKRHYGQVNALGPVFFFPQTRMERWIIRNGELITMILHNLANGTEAEARRRLDDWRRVDAAASKAPSECVLAQALGVVAEEPETNKAEYSRPPTTVATKENDPEFPDETDVMNEAVLLEWTPKSWRDDYSLLVDPSADPLQRYRAGVRIAYAEMCNEDEDQVVEKILSLWERPDGPSTGPRHREREERARRFLNDFVKLLSAAYSAGPRLGGLRFSAADHQEMITFVRTRWSEAALPMYGSRRGPLTHAVLAAIAMIVIRNINCLKRDRGAVPRSSIWNGLKLLKHLGFEGLDSMRDGSVRPLVTQAMKLLCDESTGLFVQTRKAAPSCYRSAAYAMRSDCPVGEWLTRVIPIGQLVWADRPSSPWQSDHATPDNVETEWAPWSSPLSGALGALGVPLPRSWPGDSVSATNGVEPKNEAISSNAWRSGDRPVVFSDGRNEWFPGFTTMEKEHDQTA